MVQDYYKLLKIPEDASDDIIHHQCRKIINYYKNNPEKFPDLDKKVSQISFVEKTLTDPEKRITYNEKLYGQEYSISKVLDDSFKKESYSKSNNFIQTNIIKAKFCKSCGKKIPEESEFCKFCGENLKNKTGITNSEMNNTKQKKGSIFGGDYKNYTTSQKIMWALICFLGFVLFKAVIYFINHH